MSTGPSIQGVVSGPEGLEGVVRVFELSPVEGECYAQMVGCPQLPDARAVDELPTVTEGQLRLELPVDSGVWGYLGPELPAGKRYLLVLEAPGYVIQPAGYVVPLATGKIPHIVKDLDFSVQGPHSILTPTPTPPSLETSPQTPTTFGEEQQAREKERQEQQGYNVPVAGPETGGSLVRIAGTDVQLPPDAYIKGIVGFVLCIEGTPCPPAPRYVLQRWNSTIAVSGPTGEVVAESIAPGEEEAFDFLREALR